ncbi:hypothetical protein TKWG_13190 [Advenella kashmirensis WT001]|uniref:Uncharacterized protein n=1 Tax=Advenella kashmirensis (strain DSM 17095 / LMG 22695 / WT001) TaxID=1036672 RepID=I3UCM6_ADVKW|nr:hypothetical protein [Advenella kashmirensis]AFK62764.1 hypothetical protein TKWG_13190 [Advenella kashmirensis WT001]
MPLNSYIPESELGKLHKLKFAEETIRRQLSQFIELFEEVCNKHESAKALGARLETGTKDDTWMFKSNFGAGRLAFKFDLSQNEPEGKLIFERLVQNEKDEDMWKPTLGVYFTNAFDKMYFLNSEGNRQLVSLESDFNQDIYSACRDFIKSMIYTQVQYPPA